MMEVLEMFGNLMDAGIGKLESIENITYDEITNTMKIIGYQGKTDIRKIIVRYDKNRNSTVTSYHYNFRRPPDVYNDDILNIIASIIYSQKKCC